MEIPEWILGAIIGSTPQKIHGDIPGIILGWIRRRIFWGILGGIKTNKNPRKKSKGIPESNLWNNQWRKLERNRRRSILEILGSTSKLSQEATLGVSPEGIPKKKNPDRNSWRNPRENSGEILIDQEISEKISKGTPGSTLGIPEEIYGGILRIIPEGIEERIPVAIPKKKIPVRIPKEWWKKKLVEVFIGNPKGIPTKPRRDNGRKFLWRNTWENSVRRPWSNLEMNLVMNPGRIPIDIPGWMLDGKKIHEGIPEKKRNTKNSRRKRGPK